MRLPLLRSAPNRARFLDLSVPSRLCSQLKMTRNRRSRVERTDNEPTIARPTLGLSLDRLGPTSGRDLCLPSTPTIAAFPRSGHSFVRACRLTGDHLAGSFGRCCRTFSLCLVRPDASFVCSSALHLRPCSAPYRVAADGEQTLVFWQSPLTLVARLRAGECWKTKRRTGRSLHPHEVVRPVFPLFSHPGPPLSSGFGRGRLAASPSISTSTC